VHSAENAKAVAAKAKEQYRQGNWNLCHTCIIVMLVFVIFTVMIVAIRVRQRTGNLMLSRAISWAAYICQRTHS
jgi:heme/copper-type cytochrome/quinol oxidase subunit 2